MKRPRDDAETDTVRPSKRIRHLHPDRLSSLSDELLLRVFSHVSVCDLALCQRLSHRFLILAGDSQLWKAAYYNRFVRPRAARIPGLKDIPAQADSLHFSSRISRWLDDDSLVKRGKQTNWKRQYKLRHKWSNGSCGVSEVQVAEQPSLPPLLVRLHEGIVVTADPTAGLRAWGVPTEQKLLATVALSADNGRLPTALDISKQADSESFDVVVGFDGGGFSIYSFDSLVPRFDHQYTHPPSPNGMVTAIAFTRPYLLTITEAQLLSLYTTVPASVTGQDDCTSTSPTLLSSLKSHTVWPPLSLSLRRTANEMVASIAYALPTYVSGWSVGLQELRLTHQGHVTASRLASAMEAGFTPLSPHASPRSGSGAPSPGSSDPIGLPQHSAAKPTSLSYSHPYLLASHPDNTLTLYLVTSSSSVLTISGGTRLWGHTSSVSGAHVGGRGRAVSVSSRGDELRVWELEGGINSSAAKRRLAAGEMSVQVRPVNTVDMEEVRLSLISQANVPGGASGTSFDSESLSVTRGWVGFDEEKVVVLREKAHGNQALVIYDFT
ncbi:MAG: hypothetical protein M1817_004464 [Caeruleum heppii]|nr:MAG: hypothetical protein M1817_004464 [Caeruleum heppii]